MPQSSGSVYTVCVYMLRECLPQNKNCHLQYPSCSLTVYWGQQPGITAMAYKVPKNLLSALMP